MSRTTVWLRRRLCWPRLGSRAILPLGVGLIGAVTLGTSASAAPLELGVTNTSDVRTTLRGDTAAAPRQLLRLENFAAQADASTLHVIGHSVGDQGVLRVNNASTGRGAVVLADVFPFFASSSNITGNTRGVSGQVVSPDGYGGFFSNRTTGVGTAGVGLAALGRSHDIDDTAIGPDGFDGAIEAAGPNGVEGNSITAGGFGVTGDGPAVGVNGTATTASGRGGNFTGGAQGIGVDANGGLTGLEASGGSFGVDSNVTAASAVGVRSTTGAEASDAVQANTSGGISDALQGTTTGGAAFSLFAIASGGGAGVVSSAGPGVAVSAGNSSATNNTLSASNSAPSGTAGSFTGDVALNANVNDLGGTGLEVTLTGDTDGNGTAADDANNAINASSDDTNNAAVITASTPAGSTELSHEAIETFGFLDVNGNARVTGNLDVVGTCCGPMIDNPADPSGSYLRHAGVSAPEMKNVYDGIVTTDDDGEATVTLPSYFGELNRDPRYQLTIVGDTFAQAIVSDPVDDGGDTFAIRTDEPEITVSWQVTGIRDDAYARAHPLQVIERKTGAAAGEYLHPELFGHPHATPLGLDLAAPPSRGAAARAAQADLAELVRRKVRDAKADARRPGPSIPAPAQANR